MGWEDAAKGGEPLERAGGFWPTEKTREGDFIIGRIVGIEESAKYDNKIVRIETVSGKLWPVAISKILSSFGLPSRVGKVVGIRYNGEQEVAGRRETMKMFEVVVFGDDFPDSAAEGDSSE